MRAGRAAAAGASHGVKRTLDVVFLVCGVVVALPQDLARFEGAGVDEHARATFGLIVLHLCDVDVDHAGGVVYSDCATKLQCSTHQHQEGEGD